MIDTPLTTVEVDYPAEAGRIQLRGKGSHLSWIRSLPPAMVDGMRHICTFPLRAGEVPGARKA
jgi:hypothetical protein